MSASLSASFFVYKERKRITDLHLSYTERCLGLSQRRGDGVSSLCSSRVEPQGPYAAWVGVLSSSLLQQEPSSRNRLRVQGARVIIDLHDL